VNETNMWHKLLFYQYNRAGHYNEFQNNIK